MITAATLLGATALAVAPTRAASALRACAAAPGRVALVVEHSNQALLTYCAGVGGSTTAEQVLNASGIEYRTHDFGGSLGRAVCQVDFEPVSYPANCFGTSMYWVLFVMRAGTGTWALSNTGVTNLLVQDGDAVGLRYDGQAGQPATPTSPGEVCTVAPTPTPTAAPPTPTPLPPAPSPSPAPTPAPALGPATPGAASSSAPAPGATAGATAGAIVTARPGGTATPGALGASSPASNPLSAVAIAGSVSGVRRAGPAPPAAAAAPSGPAELTAWLVAAAFALALAALLIRRRRRA